MKDLNLPWDAEAMYRIETGGMCHRKVIRTRAEWTLRQRQALHDAECDQLAEIHGELIPGRNGCLQCVKRRGTAAPAEVCKREED